MQSQSREGEYKLKEEQGCGLSVAKGRERGTWTNKGDPEEAANEDGKNSRQCLGSQVEVAISKGKRNQPTLPNTVGPEKIEVRCSTGLMPKATPPGCDLSLCLKFDLSQTRLSYTCRNVQSFSLNYGIISPMPEEGSSKSSQVPGVTLISDTLLACPSPGVYCPPSLTQIRFLLWATFPHPETRVGEIMTCNT